MLLLQDNAPAHTPKKAMSAVIECGFEILNHPPYSPDQASSYYFLFKNLKKYLRGSHFWTLKSWRRKLWTNSTACRNIIIRRDHEIGRTLQHVHSCQERLRRKIVKFQISNTNGLGSAKNLWNAPRRSVAFLNYDKLDELQLHKRRFPCISIKYFH